MKPTRFAFTLIAALAAPTVAAAQETTTDMAPATAYPADCEAEFVRFDTDGDGYLSQSESPRDHARALVGRQTIGTDGLTRDEFLQICNSEDWSRSPAEEGAPFEGANSFTEEQAKDRAIAWNVTGLSPLVKDDQGIWRGTGMLGSEAVSVAIDYKGNVVTTPTSD